MQDITDDNLKGVIEAAIFAANKPLSLSQIKQGLLANYNVKRRRLTAIIAELKADYKNRGVELIEVASGFRFQVVEKYSDDLSIYHQEKAPKFSRAMLETLALIAYKQPITRGEIEDIRGVAVSSHITKTLLEREWIKTVGQKEVPGRPVLYATTKEFLDYFSLKSLAQLPELMPIADLEITELSQEPLADSKNSTKNTTPIAESEI